jgi:LysR family transcriptional regulator, transcriptional activator of the cysJI operon
MFKSVWSLRLNFPKIDTYHLIVFYFVAKERSITLAAKRMFLTQPTVTKHIKSLENHVNSKLIEINKKKLNLTPAGESLFTYAEQVYRLTVAAERSIELVHEINLKIGISSLFVSTTAAAVNNLIKTIPHSVKLVVSIGDPYELLQEVANSKLDLALLPNTDFDFNDLKHIRISDEVELFLFASRNHPIFNNNPIEWQHLINYPLMVGPDNYPVNKILRNILNDEGILAPIKGDLTTNNLEFCKIMAAGGNSIGVAFLKDINTDIEMGKLKVLDLPRGLKLEVTAFVRRDIYFSNILIQLINYLKSGFLRT